VGIDPPAPSDVVYLEGTEVFRVGDGAVAPCGRFNIDVDRNTTVMSANDWVESERVVHSVAVESFCLDQTEVTLRQYRHCYQRGTCPPPAVTNAGDSSGTGFVRDYWNDEESYGDHPALGITHEGARAYCAFRGGRLPTELEWEYAARGRGQSASIVSDPDLIVGIEGECGDRSGSLALGACATGVHEVGSSSRDVTVDGIYDLYGNAAEWTGDEADQLAYCADDYPDGSPLETVLKLNAADEVYVVPSSSLIADATDECLTIQNNDNESSMSGRCEREFDLCATQACFRDVKDNDVNADVCLESCFKAYDRCVESCMTPGLAILCGRRGEDDAVCRPTPWCVPREDRVASDAHTIPDARRGQTIQYIFRGGHFQVTRACDARPTRRQTTHELGLPQLGFRCAYPIESQRCSAP